MDQYWHALQISLVVSGISALIASAIGIPLGALISEYRFRGKGLILSIVHGLMGLPPVVVGLVTFLLIMREGPLGELNLIYTVSAMVIAQVLLATPIVVGLTHAAIEDLDPGLGLQARSLGASRLQTIVLKIREARGAVVAASIAGFGRVVAEVGAVSMVGGAINYKTDTLTTLTVEYTRKGDYHTALWCGASLVVITIIINIFLTRLQTGRMRRESQRRVTGSAS